MIRKMTLLSASALLLGACAATASGPPGAGMQAAAPSGSMKVEDVAAAFGEGVIDGCVAAAEAGQTLEQLGSAAIVPDPDRPAMVKPRAGSTAWAPRSGLGIVMIDASPTECMVSTYGIPIQQTFATVGAALKDRGYQYEPVPLPPGDKYFAAQHSRTIDGRTVTVTLNGNEPGAPGMRSRFSTALATIRTTQP